MRLCKLRCGNSKSIFRWIYICIFLLISVQFQFLFFFAVRVCACVCSVSLSNCTRSFNRPCVFGCVCVCISNGTRAANLISFSRTKCFSVDGEVPCPDFPIPKFGEIDFFYPKTKILTKIQIKQNGKWNSVFLFSKNAIFFVEIFLHARTPKHANTGNLRKKINFLRE